MVVNRFSFEDSLLLLVIDLGFFVLSFLFYIFCHTLSRITINKISVAYLTVLERGDNQVSNKGHCEYER